MLLCLGKPNLVPDICVATQGFPLPAALGRTGVHWEEGARRGQCLEEFAAADHQLCLTSVYCLENSQILQAAPALHGAGDGSFFCPRLLDSCGETGLGKGAFHNWMEGRREEQGRLSTCPDNDVSLKNQDERTKRKEFVEKN